MKHEALTQSIPGCRSIGFLIVPEFSMVGFLCALSVFKNANRILGYDFYQLSSLSLRAEPTVASVGIVVQPNMGLEVAQDFDLVFVCAGLNPADYFSKPIGRWLHRLSRTGSALGAISTGADLLARAGLLERYRCTIYWEQAAAFNEEFPHIDLTDHIYEVDRDRFTCGGATSSIDLCLRIVEQDLGTELATMVSSTFVLDRIRDPEELQNSARDSRGQALPYKLNRAIAIMRENLDECLSIEEVASNCGLNSRHLRRLFHQFLTCSPSQYYLRLRLTRARQLLLETRMTQQQISAACGFHNASYFSTAYRRLFAHSPRDERLNCR